MAIYVKPMISSECDMGDGMKMEEEERRGEEEKKKMRRRGF